MKKDVCCAGVTGATGATGFTAATGFTGSTGGRTSPFSIKQVFSHLSGCLNCPTQKVLSADINACADQESLAHLESLAQLGPLEARGHQVSALFLQCAELSVLAARVT